MTKEQEKGYFNWKEQADDGSYYDDIQLYGMDAFPLQKVKVLKGDVTALDQENAIAAVYKQDDYDKKVDHSNWAGVGDQVTLRYVNSWKYFNAETGKEIPEEEIDSYEGACEHGSRMVIQKKPIRWWRRFWCLCNRCPVLWITAVCAWKRYVYQRYRDKRCHAYDV